MGQDLVGRFAEVVASEPDATAVVDGVRTISYRQLADLSSLLARRLSESGAVPGDIVALASDRSIEWVVGMMAVLRIGGVYLPLPPDLPLERRRVLLREGGVRHVLRHPAVGNDFGDAALVLVIGSTMPPSSDAVDRPIVSPPADHEDRACVLFTSGTTGTPKGVVVRQSSILRLVVDTNYITFTRADVVAFAANTAFDAATFEVWAALLNGIRLLVIPTATLLSPSVFEAVIREHHVTTLFLTTELFNRVARARPTAFRSLRWLLFGGEKVNVECVRAVVDSEAAPENLLHMYGPTECTTFTTFHRITKVAADAKTISIGAPITGYEVHLLNDQLHPVPNGEEGELCIAGTGLAEGYLHRAKETAAAFPVIPIAGSPLRIYRTGDRARRGAHGLIEYIGRRDGQIKVRGFRIETEEIEATLRSHPVVRDAVVLVYSGQGPTPRLGACLTMDRTADASDLGDVRDFIALRLPAPMVPACLREYETFPLTASQKIDRQRLLVDLQHADRDATESQSTGPFVPADAVERSLAGIWKGILGHEPRDADENFFDGGGDSLQAVDLQLRVEHMWRMALSPSLLIESPTFRQIAEHVRHRHTPDVRPVVWLTAASSRPVMACVPGVHGHVFFFRNLVPLWPSHSGLCALPSRYLAPNCDRRLLTLEEIATENLARLEEAGVAPIEAVAGYSFGGLVAYEMACQMAKREKPPALILYDTAARGEQARGVSLPLRMRLLFKRLLSSGLVRLGCEVPQSLFSPAAANLVAVERYRPSRYPGGMLLVRSTVEGVPHGVDAETLGWGELVQGPLTVRSVAAGHSDFFKPPHLSEVAAMTREYLRRQDACWR